MSDLAIRVEKLGKEYQIGSTSAGYRTFRETVSDAVLSPFRKLSGLVRGNASAASALSESCWALHDVSFEVRQGEVLGVIGRNGAGKSTLLKVLSRITEPTTGRVELHGRVGSLLEVGTGFHPELTGRENIFLNGAILGMRREEIMRKFDEIVEFAEVERFLDTPVKRYSSGMYMRLAFSVAAHLEPEVLVVDEVLAVGDAAFQEKCMTSMKHAAESARTILFVSHNMASIQHLCSRVILLKEGMIAAIGSPAEMTALYLSDVQRGNRVALGHWPDRVTTGEARITELETMDAGGHPTNRVAVGSTVHFVIHAEFHEPFLDPSFGVIIHNALGEPLLDLRSLHGTFRLGRVQGRVVVQVVVDQLGLYPGSYILSPWITDSTLSREVDFVKLCSTLQVDPAPGPNGDLRLDPQWGKYWVPSRWTRRDSAPSVGPMGN